MYQESVDKALHYLNKIKFLKGMSDEIYFNEITRIQSLIPEQGEEVQQIANGLEKEYEDIMYQLINVKK